MSYWPNGPKELARSWRMRDRVVEAARLVVYDAAGTDEITASVCERLGKRDPNLGELAYCVFILESYEGARVH